MRFFENFLFGVILAACLWSCGHVNSARTILDRAEMSLEAHPDSAFVELDMLDRRMLDTPELRARHALLLSQALRARATIDAAANPQAVLDKFFFMMLLLISPIHFP